MGYFEKKKIAIENLISRLDKEKEVLHSLAQRERASIQKLKKETEQKIIALNESLKNTKAAFEEESLKHEKKINYLKEGIEQMAKERQIGFPWLAKAYDELFAKEDNAFLASLRAQRRPAGKTADKVKQIQKDKRTAERELKQCQYIIEYYENVAPFLSELREEVETPTEEEQEEYKKYTDKEREDEVTSFLTIEEYRKLSPCEKNQLALDRYWKRPHSKAHIGKMYERYIGYIYEEKGYDVKYVGIIEGKEDLGRDLICSKNKDIILIQCKKWSKFKTIHEKHIFQFFGTVFQYRDKHPEQDVRAKFVTTTTLSELSRRFSKELNIELEENFDLDKTYPSIKCNMGGDKRKIYHLPFDQLYDKVKIEPHKGEFYCKTTKEAEEKGFVRAKKYMFENAYKL